MANTAAVLVIPFLAGSIWWITASADFVGREHRNSWWENLIMAGLFGLSLYGTWAAGAAIIRQLLD